MCLEDELSTIAEDPASPQQWHSQINLPHMPLAASYKMLHNPNKNEVRFVIYDTHQAHVCDLWVGLSC
jgi:hypothetical protein